MNEKVDTASWQMRKHDRDWWTSPESRGRRKRFFLGFMFLLGTVVLLVGGGMAIMAFLITRWFDGDGQTAVAVWMSGCGLALALPITAMGLARRAYRRYALPLAEMMDAADAVAAGDMSVRLKPQQGEYAQLVESFNSMTQELERADQQRRNLTADIAHELRNPLHIIQGNLEGVLDGVYEPTAEHINDTLEETHLLARLVEDLRLLSSAETGQLSLRLTAVSVPALLSDLETSFRAQAEAQGVNLDVKTAVSASIHADPDRVMQIFNNLFHNALRHTNKGGSIKLRAAPDEEQIRFFVSDTGEGIPTESLPYIFDRFWRGDRARTHRPGSGSGLGLAIVKQLVQAQHGIITVSSKPEQGTTFTIHLPRAS